MNGIEYINRMTGIYFLQKRSSFFFKYACVCGSDCHYTYYFEDLMKWDICGIIDSDGTCEQLIKEAQDFDHNIYSDALKSVWLHYGNEAVCDDSVSGEFFILRHKSLDDVFSDGIHDCNRLYAWQMLPAE